MEIPLTIFYNFIKKSDFHFGNATLSFSLYINQIYCKLYVRILNETISSVLISLEIFEN